MERRHTVHKQLESDIYDATAKLETINEANRNLQKVTHQTFF